MSLVLRSRRRVTSNQKLPGCAEDCDVPDLLRLEMDFSNYSMLRRRTRSER